MGKTIKLRNDTYLVNDLYKTTEVRVGTWIDGKPIYRKVVQFTPSTNELETRTSHHISNIDQILPSSSCLLHRINNQYVFFGMTYPYNATQILYWSMGWEATKSEIFTWIGENMRNQMDTSNYGAVAILEYTKTTD